LLSFKENHNFNSVLNIGKVLHYAVLHYFISHDQQQSFRTRKRLLHNFDPELQKQMLS